MHGMGHLKSGTGNDVYTISGKFNMNKHEGNCVIKFENNLHL